MKKIYSLLRWPCLLQDVLTTDVYCSVKQTGSSSTKGNHHPSFLSVSGIGQKKTVDAAKIRARKMLLNRNPANIRKWIARFYYLGIYTPLVLRVCIAHNNYELPIDMGNFIRTAH